jgi:hypothetical protein
VEREPWTIKGTRRVARRFLGTVVNVLGRRRGQPVTRADSNVRDDVELVSEVFSPNKLAGVSRISALCLSNAPAEISAFRREQMERGSDGNARTKERSTA